MKPSSGWPFEKAMTAGMDWMPSWPGICGCSSMFILTSFTLPPAALTAFSSTGVSCLHGPHQGAQKSTSTGCFIDSVITSWRKVAVVVSLMRSPGGEAGVSASMRSSGRAKPVIQGLRWDRRGDLAILRPRAARTGGRLGPAEAISLRDGRCGFAARFRPGLGQADDGGLVARGPRESDQLVGADAGRHRVDQRVKIDPLVGHEVGVEDQRDPRGPIVDHGKGRDGARLDPQHVPKLVGGAERQPSRGADGLVSPLEVDRGLVLCRDEKKSPLLVLHEKVLRVRAGDARLHGPRFGNREDGLMLDGVGPDAERGETVEKFLR